MSGAPITTFAGPYRFLSNFWPVQITGRDGWFFPSVEHAYQAEKTDDVLAFHKIRTARTAADAKRFGRHVPLRATWETEKLTVMYGLLLQKFQTDPLRTQLKQTGDAELIEGNTWGDTYWGVCRGVGTNHLGKLLMQVRTEAVTR